MWFQCPRFGSTNKSLKSTVPTRKEFLNSLALDSKEVELGATELQLEAHLLAVPMPFGLDSLLI